MISEQINTVRPRGTDSAEVIQVIKTKAILGYGTHEDLSRLVTQYWDFEGNMLAEHDPTTMVAEQQEDV